jgi:hypothetical protein
VSKFNNQTAFQHGTVAVIVLWSDINVVSVCLTRTRSVWHVVCVAGVPHDGDDMDQARIDSVTIVQQPGAASADAYMTSEGAGLWHSSYDPAAKDGGLKFQQQISYPFSHPTRVVQNPFNQSELWVTSFGNGLYVGQSVSEAAR